MRTLKLLSCLAIMVAIATPALAVTWDIGNPSAPTTAYVDATVTALGGTPATDGVRLVGDWVEDWSDYTKDISSIDVNGWQWTDGTGGNNHSYYGSFIGTGLIQAVGGGNATTILRGNYANTFTGMWDIRDTVRLYKLQTSTAGGIDAINGTIVLYDGTMAWAKSGSSATGSNQVNDNAAIEFSGTGLGKLSTAGWSDTVGALTLSANGTIDLGTGSSILTFSDSTAATWDLSKTLTITNWNGSATGGGAEQVIFNGLTNDQLSAIRFLNPAGRTLGTYTAIRLESGEVVPLPASLLVSQWNVNGGGNWSTAGNWTAGVPNTTGMSANFLGAISAPATVTVDAPVTVGGMKFDNANSYTVAGSTITVGGEASIEVVTGNHEISAPIALANSAATGTAAGTTLTLSGEVSGAGMTLAAGGEGTLVLSGTNTFDGGLEVKGGTVKIVGGAALADTNVVTVSTGATFDVNGSEETIATLNSTGTVNLNGGKLTLAGTATSSITGLTGTGTLVATGTGTATVGMNLTGNAGFTGDMNLTSIKVHGMGFGTGSNITMDNAKVEAIGSTSANFHILTDSTFECWGGGPRMTGNIQVDAGAIFTMATGGGNDTYFNGVISGEGDVIAQNGIRFGGAQSNTLTGVTYLVASGTLNEPALLQKTGGATAIAGDLTLDNGRKIKLDSAGNQIADTSTVTLLGTAQFQLNGFEESILALVMDSLTDGTTGAYAGATVDTGVSGILYTTSLTWGGVALPEGQYYASAENPFVLGGGYINIGELPPPPTPETGWASAVDGNWSVNENWYPGAPAGVDAQAIFGQKVAGPIVVTVDAPVTVGSMKFDNANKYTVTGGQVTLQASTGNAAINVVKGNHEIAAPVAMASSTDVTVAATTTLLVSGVLSGPQSSTLTYAGAGKVRLMGANTYDGATVIDGATVVMGNDDAWEGNAVNALGSTVSGTTLKNGANLVFLDTWTDTGTPAGSLPSNNVTNESFTVESDSQMSFWDLGTGVHGNVAINSGATLTVNTGGGNLVNFSGTISGQGDFNFIGGGANPGYLTGNNTLAGNLMIGNGALRVNGTLDHANIYVGGATSVLAGSGVIKFNAGETITLLDGGKLDPTAVSSHEFNADGTLVFGADGEPVLAAATTGLTFDLTGLTGTTATLVDYTAGVFVAPADLNTLLTAASLSKGWSLTDTGTLITAALVARLIGDTNGDGTVDLTDLNNVRNNFGTTAAGVTGDTNGDGTVDLTDLNNVRNHFGESLGATNVPEPATLALLSLGGLALLRRRNSK